MLANTEAITKTHTAEELYLDLLKKCLTRYLIGEPGGWGIPKGNPIWFLYQPLRKLLAQKGWELVLRSTRPFDPQTRALGQDSSANAETMIGLKRLDNIQYCVTDVLKRGIPGDLIETGAWRGGACIFMRAVLKVFGDTNRSVWVADSFQGLPKPDTERFPTDAGVDLWKETFFSVSLEDVKSNFERYGMLDEQVRFLPGWFKNTLPNAPIERLAVMRLDGDLYESTIEALQHLYHKLSVGGYVIIDDYGGIRECRQAVDDFRKMNRIEDEIQWVDWTGIFWQRTRA